MTDEKLSISDATLIARLRKVDEYEPLGHDGWEAADRIYNLGLLHDMAEVKVEALVKARREDALELLAALGQAQEAYEAQLKAEARAEQLAAKCERLEEALQAILFTAHADDYVGWRTALEDARAALTQKDRTDG